MKIKKLNILILSTLLLSFISCEDYFELKRPQETQWTTTSTFEQGLSNCYWNIQWSGMNRGNPLLQDYATSGIARTFDGGWPGNNADKLYFRQFGERLGKLSDAWKYAYRVITLSSIAIELDKNANGNAFNLDINSSDYQDNYLRQVGEYYFCRAYAYFSLVKIFVPPYNHNGDNSTKTIPLKIKAASSKEEVLNEELGTKEEIYQQIISDLKYAKNILPDKFVLNSWNNVAGYECGRANKWVAASLLGKVYFLMGKYTEAKAEFDSVINYAESTGAYSLEEAPKEAFNKEKAQDYPKESIWEFNSGDLNGRYEQHNNYVYVGGTMGLRSRDSNGDELFSSSENGVGTVLDGGTYFAVSYKALKQMGWMEDPMNGDYTITSEAEADLRYQQVYHLMLPYKEGIQKGDPEYITTYSQGLFTNVHTPNIHLDKFFRGAYPYGRFSKFPFIRLADIYLLRSWLRWNSDDLSGAANDLNVVWNRSNPNNQDKHTASNVTHESIYAEYLREMTGEGWTVDFMMGTQMDIPAGDNPLNTAVSPPYSNWFWQIPPEEEGLNHNYQ